MTKKNDNNIRFFQPKMVFAYVVIVYMCILTGCAIRYPKSLEPQDTNPAWAPNSTQIAFVCYRQQAAREWDLDTPYLGPYSGLDAHKLLEICVSDINGDNRHQLTDNMVTDAAPVWSPTGNQIAFLSRQNISGGIDIYVMSSNGTDLVNLTNHPAGDGSPLWSPDGNIIAFSSTRDNINSDIYTMRADGSQVTRLTKVGWVWDHNWSADGKFIVFSGGVSSESELFIVDVESRLVTQITNNQVEDFSPVLSPDGRKIAFSSYRQNGVQVYMIDIQTREEIRISEGPGPASQPSWSPNGQFLAYINKTRNFKKVLQILDLTTGNLIDISDFRAIDGVLWSPNSQYLLYERLEDWNKDGFQETKLWVLQVEDGAQWAVSSANNQLAEAEIAKQYALKRGIPLDDILLETVSKTTEQNLYYAKQLAAKHHLKTVIIVSDPLHMKRAMLIAEDMGLVAYSSPTPTTRYQSWHTQLKFLLRETYFYQRYLLRRLFYRYNPTNTQRS